MAETTPKTHPLRDASARAPTERHHNVTAAMVSAGLIAYREFLGDDRPLITDEKALVVVIYAAMEAAKKREQETLEQRSLTHACLF